MKTRKCIILFLLITVIKINAISAQSADSTVRKAASYFHEAENASANQKIWPLKLYGPMMFVDESTRTALANMADDSGILKPDGEVYKGILPKSVMIANTAVTWGGRTWTEVYWPLPSDRDDRVNLMLHECFHRIQGELNLPARNRTAVHLSSREGRIYFLLELLSN